MTGPLQAIATGLLQPIVIDPLEAIAIGPAQAIEIGPKLATAAVVAETQAKVGLARRARRLRRQARKRTASQVRRRARDRASRSAILHFQTSNQVPRLVLKPIVAAKASAVGEERPAWPPAAAEEGERPA